MHYLPPPDVGSLPLWAGSLSQRPAMKFLGPLTTATPETTGRAMLCRAGPGPHCQPPAPRRKQEGCGPECARPLCGGGAAGSAPCCNAALPPRTLRCNWIISVIMLPAQQLLFSLSSSLALLPQLLPSLAENKWLPFPQGRVLTP